MSSSGEFSGSRTAAFTIVSKNYLHYARVLMASVRRAHPDFDLFVLLADRVEDRFDPSREPFAVDSIDQLPIPDANRFRFRYTILELNTAVKPWYFRELFKRGYRHVIYLDPDIFVYRPLHEVTTALDSGALAVLVPHLTGRLRDGRYPDEHAILQSGAYNLGFCALGVHASLDALLDFWCEKSLRHFTVDLSRGLFTDQRWMDLVPGMFADVRILRHEGYDVAYWNLAHRHISRHGSEVRANDVPLVFFHFSGFDPFYPEAFSKHQNRYTTKTAGEAGLLAREYGSALAAAGAAACRDWPYAYGRLRDGSPIPDSFRQLYRSVPEVERWGGDDPFERTAADWNAPLDDHPCPLSRAMLAVYHTRTDLRLKWPDVHGEQRADYVEWYANTAELQAMPACYRTTPPRRPPAPEHVSRPRHAAADPVSVSPRLVSAALRKALIAWREGRLPISPRKWVKLYRLHVRETRDAAVPSSALPLPPTPWPAFTSTEESGSAPPLGLSIVGYLQDGTGVSAGAYGAAEAARAAGIEVEVLDARPATPPPGQYGVNLFHVNADEMPRIAGFFDRGFFERRRTIGYWAWEMERFPARFHQAFEFVDEIWTPSTFVHRAVSDVSRLPVVCMPHSVTVNPEPGVSRRDFGLPPDGFLFLMMYDLLSIQERKNPLGAVAAFRKAFPGGRDATLVIRANHAASRPADVTTLRDAIASTPGVVLLDGVMSRGRAQALMSVCDAFVSLHRSEGFGLNIAEAMLLGKPAIATGWSGNTDFMTPGNSCLVDYQLVTLDRAYGPYDAGSRWAAPDIDHAAELMQKVASDHTFRQEIAARGRKTISEEYSPAAIGARYLRRLEQLRIHGARHRVS